MSKPRNNPGLAVFAAEIPQLGLFTLEKGPEDLGRGLFGLEKSHNQGAFTWGKIQKATQEKEEGPFMLGKAQNGPLAGGPICTGESPMWTPGTLYHWQSRYNNAGENPFTWQLWRISTACQSAGESPVAAGNTQAVDTS
ncbi:hypothetical protein EDD15DRAFT_2198284 [Pisolithus albus]|nr:hypothetical protein EDD15DRAFT_2198284 [Pisolithus albus]